LRYANTKLEAFHMNIKACVFALALALVPATAFAQSAPQTTAPNVAPQAAAPEAQQKTRTACAVDVQKFCANIERAKGAMRTCLEAHETQLSDGCKAARAERAAAKAKDKS
jgi:Skp family chaperone for outer membrane proteins